MGAGLRWPADTLLHLMVELGRDLGVPCRWSGKHILVPGLGSNSLIIVHYPESDQIERNIQRLRGEETTRPAPPQVLCCMLQRA